MADEPLAEQRRVTKLALDALASDGFALAGSGAIREHGFIDRPTQDVDLFTVQSAQDRFSPALDRMIRRFEQAGYHVETLRRQAGFAHLDVTSPTGAETAVDLGVDWRADPTVHLDVGPVLAPDDAVGNKIAALFSRGEARDYLDVDQIRRSGRYSDQRLIELARRADAGFDLEWFAQSLDEVARLAPPQVADYGVSPDQLADITRRLTAWADTIRSHPHPDDTRPIIPTRIDRETQPRPHPTPGRDNTPSRDDDQPPYLEPPEPDIGF